MTKPISPRSLNGPRVYFTDWDRLSAALDGPNVSRKLKLQLMLKDRVVIAASSLFDARSSQIIERDRGLLRALSSGALLPAIRDEYDSVEEFFLSKRDEPSGERDYPVAAEKLFVSSVAQYVPWSLEDNTAFFRDRLLGDITDPDSVFRHRSGIDDNEAKNFVARVDFEMTRRSARFVTREIVSDASTALEGRARQLVNAYATLIYRISGARVVNCEGHFPQSNLVSVDLTSDDKQLADESVFWDLYLETVYRYIASVATFPANTLDRLSFDDVMNIRDRLRVFDFTTEYDQLIAAAKAKVSLRDPDGLILRQEEILRIASLLREGFDARLRHEFGVEERSERENALIETADLVKDLAEDVVNQALLGTVTVLKAIPTITALFSKEMAGKISLRVARVRHLINTRIGWSGDQQKTFLRGFEEMVTWGLPGKR